MTTIAWLTAVTLATAPAPVAAPEAAAPAAELVAGLWSDSTVVPWYPQSHAVVRSGRLTGVAADGVLTGGISQFAGRSAYAGRAQGRFVMPLTPRLAAEVHAGVLAVDAGSSFDRQATRTQARLRLGAPERNAWLGVAFERGLSGGRLPEGAMLGLGAAARVSEIAFSASVEQTAERVRTASQVLGEAASETTSAPIITVYDSRYSTSTSALLSGRWARGRVALETVAGLTLNRLRPPQRWSQTSASVAVLPRLSVFGTLGNAAPRWLALDAGFERRATLGLRLTSERNPGASDEPDEPRLPRWRLRYLRQDWYVVEIRARDAQQVWAMGDFTEWKEIPLRHVTGERWAVAVRVAPGVHQVQVRVDGGLWQPPAGLATSADGFNGSAGVFVAE